MSRRTADTAFWGSGWRFKGIAQTGHIYKGQMKRNPQICTSWPVGESAPPRADRRLGFLIGQAPGFPFVGTATSFKCNPKKILRLQISSDSEVQSCGTQ